MEVICVEGWLRVVWAVRRHAGLGSAHGTVLEFEFVELALHLDFLLNG